jgi:hypothetical protein
MQLSKSAVNHRLRRLVEMAEGVPEEGEAAPEGREPVGLGTRSA